VREAVRSRCEVYVKALLEKRHVSITIYACVVYMVIGENGVM
jgi:hypothetical protein